MSDMFPSKEEIAKLRAQKIAEMEANGENVEHLKMLPSPKLAEQRIPLAVATTEWINLSNLIFF